MNTADFEHYLRDESRRGPAPDGAFSGAAGGAACGDLVRISLLVGDGQVEGATFDAEGCGATRAAAAATAELVENEAVLDAARLDPGEIADAIGGLSAGKRHAADLAADALHRAMGTMASSGTVLAEPAGERVLVAISGGVDSAVAALQERERGADVVAVTVKLWTDRVTDGAKACCSPEAVIGARRLAHSMGIPHLTLDLEQQFRAAVVDPFVAGYAEGRTPNPCVRCNGSVRIDAMVDLADRVGASHLATGHYAGLRDDGEGALLAAAIDAAKDQTYMLSALSGETLARLRFPLAELTKPEVRAIAARAGLPVASKSESQDLCFLAGEGKRSFLERHGELRDRPGQVVDRRGQVLGRHRGHHHFTVGQRRGIGVAADQPLYVLGTDASRNTVTVGSRDDLAADGVVVRDAVLHRDADRVDRVRLRYRSRPVPARVAATAAPGRYDELELELGEPFHGVAPGQTACLMSGDLIVGSGTIAAADRPRARAY
jgi:tRNA-specific 2-thiouridylase